MPRGPSPQREPMGLCLSVFDYLTQSSLSLRAFLIGCLPFSEQTPSALNIDCELPRGRKAYFLEMCGFKGSRGGLPLSGSQWASTYLFITTQLIFSLFESI